MWSFPKSWPKFVPTSAWKIPYTMTMSPKPERQGGISVHPFPRRSIRTPWRPLCTVTLTPKVIRCCPLWYHIRTICIAELAGISRDRFGTTTKSSSKQYFPLYHQSSSSSSHRYYFASGDGIRNCLRMWSFFYRLKSIYVGYESKANFLTYALQSFDFALQIAENLFWRVVWIFNEIGSYLAW